MSSYDNVYPDEDEEFKHIEHILESIGGSENSKDT